MQTNNRNRNRKNTKPEAWTATTISQVTEETAEATTMKPIYIVRLKQHHDVKFNLIPNLIHCI
jgi:hypothetical protein